MSLLTERVFFRLAVVGALVASLGLAACGRKGPLDPPPGAALDDGAPRAQQSSSSLNPIGTQPLGGATQTGSNNMLETPPGPKKRIPLDALLN